MATRSEERLQEALEEAQATIREQQETIEQLQAGPWLHASVVERRKDSLIVGMPGAGVVEIPIKGAKLPYKVGDTVRVSGQGALTEPTLGISFGDIATVVECKPLCGELQQVEVSVSAGGGNRLVFAGPLAGKLTEGDTVVLDPLGVMVKQKATSAKPKFAFDGATGIGWDDIIGLAGPKRTLREAIEGPKLHADIYARWGRKPLKGIALEGPPGNGKTLLAKAAATATRELYDGKAAASGFIYVKGPELLVKWVGESEATIRALFAAARKHKAAYGYPAILFIDEADAILRKRGSGRSSDMESTIVPMFLAEMDGLEESSALVLLATNRLDVLDPAVLREGRIDRKLTIGRPDEPTTREMLHYYIKKMPIGEHPHLDLAAGGAKVIFSDKCPIGEGRFLCDEVSGAMVAGIAERAADFAMSREMDDKTAPQGLTWRDMELAIAAVWQEHINVRESAKAGAWAAA